MREVSAEACEGDDGMIVYPLLLLLHVTLVPAGIALILISLRRTLARHQCPNCGYDTRASADHCPECGSPLSLRRRPRASSEQRFLRVLGIGLLAVPLMCDIAVVLILIWAGFTMR